jgi:hypothetical protein
MPFSKYDAAFNADLMKAMRAAFYRVCDILQLSGDREDPLTEIVVTKIVERAKAGECGPEILCIDVLAELGTPSQGVTSPAPELRPAETVRMEHREKHRLHRKAPRPSTGPLRSRQGDERLSAARSRVAGSGVTPF